MIRGIFFVIPSPSGKNWTMKCYLAGLPARVPCFIFTGNKFISQHDSNTALEKSLLASMKRWPLNYFRYQFRRRLMFVVGGSFMAGFSLSH
jgi:hypothetical protein